jgi:5-methylthioadenosine/S-adenosylhomocysteine deaminase
VWIDGKRKLRERELVDMHLDGILANARQWRERIGGISH